MKSGSRGAIGVSWNVGALGRSIRESDFDVMFYDDDHLRVLRSLPELNGHGTSPELNGRERKTRQARRIAIYSHDAQGLGHLRRNLLITRSLVSEGFVPSVLVLSGLRETASYEFPPGVDCLTLPALGKDARGKYHARSLRVELDEIVRMRSTLIRGAVESFRPDVLIVDKLPLGIFGELESALEWLRVGAGARIILGLRDILDEPSAVLREWEQQRAFDAMRRYYDRVWIYGDRSVYDAGVEYDVPDDIAIKFRYTGYLNPRHAERQAGSDAPAGRPRLPDSMDLPPGSLTLCSVGGGRDGMPLASEFLRAPLPEGTGGVLVTGPLMDGEDRALLHALASRRRDMRLVEFVTDPGPLMCCADRVICMGGYNSVCEALAFEKPTLVVPRVVPRKEQLIRAERLSALGLLDMLHPDRLSAGALGEWIRRDAARARSAEAAIDFGGVRRIPELLREAMTEVVVPAGKAVVRG